MTIPLSLDLFLKEVRLMIEQQLNRLVAEELDKPYATLFSAARYSLLSGGKRLRPILTLMTAHMFDVPLEFCMSAACSLEMIHCYSLIHDDLPCMDNDDYRRGRLSLHRAFDEGHAILAADYLLTDSFGVISNDLKLTAKQKVALISLLAKKAGSQGMVSGQIMDIEAKDKTITLEQLNCIHRYKTGALITTAIEFGAIIGGASKEERRALIYFGDQLGLAFQILDDILDVTASEEKHGKKISSDEINQKMTYVGLLGVDTSHQCVSQLLQQAKIALASLGRNTQLLQDFANYLLIPSSPTCP